MLKFKDTMVTFEEVPSEVTLCVNITGCPIHCPDCHSKHLWEDIGEELKPVTVSNLIAKNDGITTVCFMGGDNAPEEVYELAKWVKDNTELKVGWYSGKNLNINMPLEYFDFIKTGPYKKELGGLDSITTNQRFYEVKKKYAYNSNDVMYRYLEDVTYKFWKKKNEVGNSKDAQR